MSKVSFDEKVRMGRKMFFDPDENEIKRFKGELKGGVDNIQYADQQFLGCKVSDSNMFNCSVSESNGAFIPQLVCNVCISHIVCKNRNYFTLSMLVSLSVR
jgi:hypothetical protein